MDTDTETGQSSRSFASEMPSAIGIFVIAVIALMFRDFPWIGILLWLICVYKFHQVLGSLSLGRYPISPVYAAIGNLIPIFNLYWIFNWTIEFSQFIRTNSPVNVLPGRTIGLVFLLLEIIRRMNSAIGIVGFSIMMFYLQFVLSKQIKYFNICATKSDLAYSELLKGLQFMASPFNVQCQQCQDFASLPDEIINAVDFTLIPVLAKTGALAKTQALALLDYSKFLNTYEMVDEEIPAQAFLKYDEFLNPNETADNNDDGLQDNDDGRLRKVETDPWFQELRERATALLDSLRERTTN